jgi:hypothetical protein
MRLGLYVAHLMTMVLISSHLSNYGIYILSARNKRPTMMLGGQKTERNMRGHAGSLASWLEVIQSQITFPVTVMFRGFILYHCTG